MLALRLALVVALLSLPACSSRPAPGDLTSPPQDAAGADRRSDLGAASPDHPAPDGQALTCATVLGSFQPCGGTLEGTSWQLAELCPEDPAAASALFEHPFDDLPACQDRSLNTVQGRLVVSGTVSFAGGELALDRKLVAEVSYGFTDACLAAIAPSATDPASVCAARAKPGVMTCSYAPGLCTCQATVPDADIVGTDPYTVVDQSSFRVGELTVRYCLSPNSLVLDWSPHPVSWRYWLLRR